MDDAEKINLKKSLKELMSEENLQFQKLKAIKQSENFDKMHTAFLEAKYASVSFREKINNLKLYFKYKYENNELSWYENRLNEAILLFNIIAEKLGTPRTNSV